MSRTKIPIVVAYRKRPRGRAYIEVFENLRVDDILDAGGRKPPIPHKFEIVALGVGTSFIEQYKKKYKLTKHKTWH